MCDIDYLYLSGSLLYDPNRARTSAIAIGNQAKTPQVWQIQGVLAALTNTDAGVRGIAFTQSSKYDLSNIEDRFSIAKQAITRFNARIDEDERWAAALALGNLGDATVLYLKDLGNLLNTAPIQTGIQGEVAHIFGQLGTAAIPYHCR